MNIDTDRVFSYEELIKIFDDKEKTGDEWKKFQAYKQYCLNILSKVEDSLMQGETRPLFSFLGNYYGVLGREGILDFSIRKEKDKATSFGVALTILEELFEKIESTFGKESLKPKKEKELLLLGYFDKSVWEQYNTYTINITKKLIVGLHNNNFVELKKHIGRGGLVHFTASEEELELFLLTLESLKQEKDFL